MPFEKGREKTGGREKGTPNRERELIRNLITERYPDYHPVIAMTEIALDENNPVELRLSAHKEVAKYIEPQLKSTEVKIGRAHV